jgi:hypothetical protein
MRIMVIRKADPETEANVLPTRELVEQMIGFHEEMAKAGILRGGDGLRSSVDGVRLKFNDGKPTVIDGPFAETKELVAGYTLIEVASMEEALSWFKRWPVLDGHGNVELELRPLHEMEDFGEAVTPELNETAKRIFEQG